MGAIYDDLEGHEGYALRRLPDGTLTSTATAVMSEFRSYVAACECRWTGADHPATEDGYEDAVDEWEHRHARPLLAQTVPVDVRDKTREMKRALVELVDQRPIAGLKAASELVTWAEALAARTRGTQRNTVVTEKGGHDYRRLRR
ncbi:MAG: hypothetical protein M3P53_10935 [Actinomycetota bacterium]|nr:hypothetical protein [Actinomycetota bacterium]